MKLKVITHEEPISGRRTYSVHPYKETWSNKPTAIVKALQDQGALGFEDDEGTLELFDLAYYMRHDTGITFTSCA
jgi:hypothetical protein